MAPGWAAITHSWRDVLFVACCGWGGLWTGCVSAKAAIRFLSRLLNAHPKPRVIVTDKLRSYTKPIRQMGKGIAHRSHKGLNNRVENAHQPTRRKEKCIIRFKSPAGAQNVIALIGTTRNLFAVAVGRYTKSAQQRKNQFHSAKETWNAAAIELLCA